MAPRRRKRKRACTGEVMAAKVGGLGCKHSRPLRFVHGSRARSVLVGVAGIQGLLT